MGDYVLYKALQSYKANDPGVLGFRKDDVFQIPIQSPFTETETQRAGLLYAYNRRTREEGYVPGRAIRYDGKHEVTLLLQSS